MGNSNLAEARLYRKAFTSAVLTTAAQASKIMVGFLALKLIALYMGPDGLGRLGHFMSVTSILVLLAGGGIGHGVIKYAAEYRKKPFKLYQLLSTATAFAVVVSALLAIVFIVFSNTLANAILGDSGLYWVIVLLAISQLGFTFNMLFSSFANGLGDIRSFALAQVLGNVAAIPLAWFSISKFGLPGAAVAVILVMFMSLVPSVFIYYRSSLRGRFKLKNIQVVLIKQLSWFGLMLFVSALAFPVVEIFIRQLLIENWGYAEAGSWQAVIRLSSAYLGFFSVFLASHFMPMVSGASSRNEIARLTCKFLGLVMVVFLLGGGGLYFFRSFFIPLLLSNAFDDVQNFIIYQLVGDFFKASGYVLGFVAVARAARKIYIAAEISQAVLFVLLSIVVAQFMGGAQGVTFAYMCASVAYFSIALGVFVYWVRK